MITIRCPRCGEDTKHVSINGKGNSHLLWCQQCYYVSLDKWDLSISLERGRSSSSLRTNVEFLENDHIHLMEMLQYMTAAGNCNSDLTKKYVAFQKELRVHYRREERFLDEIGYPHLEEHARHHEAAYSIMRAISSLIGVVPTEAIIFSLKGSLIDLFLEDMDYKCYVEDLIDRMPETEFQPWLMHQCRAPSSHARRLD